MIFSVVNRHLLKYPYKKLFNGQGDVILKILIAEDNENTSKLYNKIFRSRGHQVILTNNGSECITRFRRETIRHNDPVIPFDVIILDFAMPLKSGVEVAKEILELNPNQRIIFISAYPNKMLSEYKNSEKPIEFLSKPFSIAALLIIVENTQKTLKDKIPEFEKWDELSGLSEAFGAPRSAHYK